LTTARQWLAGAVVGLFVGLVALLGWFRRGGRQQGERLTPTPPRPTPSTGELEAAELEALHDSAAAEIAEVAEVADDTDHDQRSEDLSRLLRRR
jgi:hypothetical protein